MKETNKQWRENRSLGHLPFVNMDGFMVQELSIENNRNSYWKSFRFDPFRWPYIYSNIRAWNSPARENPSWNGLFLLFAD